MSKLLHVLAFLPALMAIGWAYGVFINLFEGSFEKIPEGVGYTVIFAGVSYALQHLSDKIDDN